VLSFNYVFAAVCVTKGWWW